MEQRDANDHDRIRARAHALERGIIAEVMDGQALPLADESFAAARDIISSSAGWFYGAVVSAALIMCVVLALGHWGAVRLGAEDYADEILSTLEVNLQKFLAAVQRGRDRLAGRDEEPLEVQ